MLDENLNQVKSHTLALGWDASTLQNTIFREESDIFQKKKWSV